MDRGDEILEDLFWCARIGDEAQIFSMISEYPDVINSCDERGCSILHMICANNNLDLLKSLKDKLDLPLLLNKPNSSGNNPIHWAVLNRHCQMVEYLVSLGANYRSLNYNGESPIEIALMNGDSKLEHFLENLLVCSETSEV